MNKLPRAIVAGHICLDFIPDLSHHDGVQFGELFQPGRLIEVYPALFMTGGPVSNTGLALHRLGIPTLLVAKIGKDLFGEGVCNILRSFDPQLVEGIIIDPDSQTSYSVVINLSGVDRIFLHHPGANDTFSAADVPPDLFAGASLFHFGYPPVMRRMYQNGGEELVKVLQAARNAGMTVSLDMAFPDPSSESGRADWRQILKNSLPYVDIFLPSIEELLFMLHREEYQRLSEAAKGESILPAIRAERLSEAGQELLEMGIKIAALKLGDRGLYLRTAGRERMAEMGKARPENWELWADQELWAPCFQVEVAGTAGSGDATIAGFLSSLLCSDPPQTAMTMAVAVGACNVEAVDTLSGIRSWEDTRRRVAAGWARRPLQLDASGWRWDTAGQVWTGPNHRPRPAGD